MKIISFEGFEYSGKSTQIKLLQRYFKKNKISSTFTREPGGNKQLEKIRKIILQSDFNNLSLILFFFASRFSLLSSMKTKDLVVFDRFFDSTSAINYLNNEFSFESFTPETVFYVLPVFEDVLRGGQLDLSQRVRRSNLLR